MKIDTIKEFVETLSEKASLKFIGALAIMAACIFLARANDEGISSRFYAFTNFGLGPASSVNSNMVIVGGQTSNMWQGMNSTNWYEYHIKKGRGVGMFLPVTATNPAPTGTITWTFDLSPFGSTNKTAPGG